MPELSDAIKVIKRNKSIITSDELIVLLEIVLRHLTLYKIIACMRGVLDLEKRKQIAKEVIEHNI